jgi:N-acetylneuraminate lyase
LIRAFEKGDLATARAAQFQATETVKTLAALGFTAASKAVMSFVGVHCRPVRPLLRYLSPEQLNTLIDALQPLGFLCRISSASEVDRAGSAWKD